MHHRRHCLSASSCAATAAMGISPAAALERASVYRLGHWQMRSSPDQTPARLACACVKPQKFRKREHMTKELLLSESSSASAQRVQRFRPARNLQDHVESSPATHQRHRLSTALFAVLAASAGPAAAQSENGVAPGTTDLDKVTVTGSRIARTGFVTPSQVTAISAEEIRAPPRPPSAT